MSEHPPARSPHGDLLPDTPIDTGGTQGPRRKEPNDDDLAQRALTQLRKHHDHAGLVGIGERLLRGPLRPQHLRLARHLSCRVNRALVRFTCSADLASRVSACAGESRSQANDQWIAAQSPEVNSAITPSGVRRATRS